MDNTIFITGAGIISAVGNNKAETKQSLLAKESGIGELHHLQSAHRELPCGEVKMSNEELREMLGMPEGKACNRTALLGIEAIRQALEQSGIAPEEAFLVSGTTVGGMDATERHFLEMLEDDRHLALLASHDSGSTTKLMAEYFGIPSGHTATVSTACSSAANALIVGANMIKTGKAEKVIAGGSESLSLFHLNGFNTLMVLDTERCRPFDATRKGLNLGEGASFVVLESAASVMRRGGKPLAILSGYGNRCDAFHQTASSPDGEGAYLAMKEALDMAGLSPGQIDYVNAHGTGTLNNDSSESVALKRIFGQDMPPRLKHQAFHRPHDLRFRQHRNDHLSVGHAGRLHSGKPGLAKPNAGRHHPGGRTHGHPPEAHHVQQFRIRRKRLFLGNLASRKPHRRPGHPRTKLR